LHKIRNRRQLAAVRELWLSRDELAQHRDLAPGRVLPDSAILTAVLADPKSTSELQALPIFGGRHHRRLANRWFGALQRAHRVPESALPQQTMQNDGPPPVNRWTERDPVAAARLAAARGGLAELAERLRVPAENLLAPELVRRLAWSPPPDADLAGVAEVLHRGGARAWQVELTAGPLSDALGRVLAAGPVAD